MKVKRYFLLIISGIILLIGGLIFCLDLRLFSIAKDSLKEIFYHSNILVIIFGIVLGLTGIGVIIIGVRNLSKSIFKTIVPQKADKIPELIYKKVQLNKGPKIVVIGGGTGLSVLLRGLKLFSNNITAVVTVFDTGGSSGRLRKELGVLPPGDIRNCLVALADEEPLMERLFQYRFSNGSLEGHSFGNLFITAMSEVSGNFVKAIEKSSEVLAIHGRVLPSSLVNVTLSAKMKDGEIIRGENNISHRGKIIDKIYLESPSVLPLPETLRAIKEAEAIILGPGSLYTSIICNLLVKNIPEAIIESKAKKIYICNIMTQPGETDYYSASQHLKEVNKYLGLNSIDYIIVNSEEIDNKLKEKYSKESAYQVVIDESEILNMGVKLISKDLCCKQNLARHNSDKLAKAIMNVISKRKG
jgi:uncharacterized cofD-like protein